eukprot:6181817-Pleurochrysis_carterae.AAC.6
MAAACPVTRRGSSVRSTWLAAARMQRCMQMKQDGNLPRVTACRRSDRRMRLNAACAESETIAT